MLQGSPNLSSSASPISRRALKFAPKSGAYAISPRPHSFKRNTKQRLTRSDFKSLASADFATRAWIFNQSFAAAARFAILTTLVESLGTTDSLIPRIAAFIASADGCTYFRETLMMLAP